MRERSDHDYHVFRGSFDPAAAEAVVGVPESALESLTGSLLERLEEARYRVRSRDDGSAGTNPLPAELLERHAVFYARRLREIGPGLQRGEAGACRVARHDASNIASALVYLAEGGRWQDLLESLLPFSTVCAVLEDPALALHTYAALERALADATPPPSSTDRVALERHVHCEVVSFLLQDDRRLQEALERSERLLERARSEGDARFLALATYLRGNTLRYAMHSEECEPLLEEALRLTEGTDWLLLRANIRLALGFLARRRFRLEEAALHFDAAVRHARDEPDANRLWQALMMLGDVLLTQKKTNDAILYLTQAKTITERLDRPLARAALLNSLGSAHFYAFEFRAMRAAYEEAIAIARGMHDEHIETVLLANLGAALRIKGEPALGRERLLRSLELARTNGDTFSIAFAQSHLGAIANDLGELDEARERLEEGLALAPELGNRPLEAHLALELSRTHQKAFRTNEARDLVDRALELGRQLSHRDTQLWAVAQRCELELANGNESAALHDALEVLPGLPQFSTELQVDASMPTWSAYRALLVAGDDRAADVLEDGYRRVMNATARLEPHELEAYLDGYPARRYLVREYRKLRSSAN